MLPAAARVLRDLGLPTTLPLRPRVPPESYATPVAPAAPTLTLRWLGTAGFELTGAGRTVVLDPFVTRPGLLATGLRPLRPDPARVARYVPRADLVLVGHAHHDHVLDAPEVCRQTGALLVGSRAVANVARAAGLPEAQIRVTAGLEDLALAGARVRGLPSRHGRVYLGRVPFAGDIPTPPPWPPRLHHLRHGDVLNWSVELAGHRVVHIDSADFEGAHLEGLRADVLCLCAIGRAGRPRYVEEAVERLRPRYVVPCHWDWFFDPLDAPARALPGVDLPGFLEEIRAAGATPVLLPPLGRLDL